jgi:tetratricopeptide (TPR) repeat protein
MVDGSQPPDRVEIIRVCSTNSTRSAGHTDSKGYFGFQLNGQNLMASMDAADGGLSDTPQGFPTGMRTSTSPAGASDFYFDCELRARLAGYRSSSISLAGRKSLDSPDVGRLVLYPISASDGQAISATSAGASKDARKSFEKGVSEAKKQRFENAEKELRKAVELYPRYADAWMELGKTFVATKKMTEAHDAFAKAVEADPRYTYPYEYLYMVAFELERWQEVADTSARLLRLNPYEFPSAYYYNGVAHYQMKNWDTAEQSLAKGIDVDQRKTIPKSRYVLGLVQIQKKNYVGATKSLSEYVALAPNDPQAPKIQALLEELRQAPR